jgi:hypothetical protein
MAVKKVGYLTMHIYRDVQNFFGTAICFDRECSPVARAMHDNDERAGASEKHVKNQRNVLQRRANKAEARNCVGD